MRCFVLGCPSYYAKYRPNNDVSFHRFPTEKKLRDLWIAATGRSDFEPSHLSKICSRHFEKTCYVHSGSKHLKQDALPTKFLAHSGATTDYKRSIYEGENEENCIMVYTPKEVSVLKQETTVVKDFPPVSKSSVSNFDLCNIACPQYINNLPSSQQNKIPPQVVSQAEKSAIKPPVSSSQTNSFKQTTSSVKKSIDDNHTTVSQIHRSLRNILPGSFDMSRLIPNDKLASLIIRYLKLKETKKINFEVLGNLEIISKASKSNEKKYTKYSTHPFINIGVKDLQSALNKVLPKDFSARDVTDDVLKFLCIALNQEIYVDGFPILRDKIYHILNKKEKKNQVLNKRCKINAPVADEQIISSVPHTANENVHHEDFYPKPIFVDVNNPSQSDNDFSDTEIKLLPENNNVPSEITPIKKETAPNKKRKRKLMKENDCEWKFQNLENNYSDFSDDEETFADIYEKRKLKSKEDVEWKPENETHSVNKPYKPGIHPVEDLELLVKYLDDKKTSAKDVLSSFNLMFYLCRFLRIKTRSAAVKKLKSSLLYIMNNNINLENVGSYVEDFMNQRIITPETKNKIKSKRKSGIDNDKLKQKPIVVLQNRTDFSIDQLLFMTRSKKSNSSFNRTSVPINQNPEFNKYTSDYVRKLTENSYKQFRKIIMKKNGNMVIFRLKYMTLKPGTVVYVRHFNPHLGWTKGIIKRYNGNLSYQVQLDSGESWSCYVDQFRPLFDSFPNTIENLKKRSVKPKKVLDL